MGLANRMLKPGRVGNLARLRLFFVSLPLLICLVLGEELPAEAADLPGPSMW